jgi:hypothetical protein
VTAPLGEVTGVVRRAPVSAWFRLVLAATGLQVGDNGIPAEHLAPDTSSARWPFLMAFDVDGGEEWAGLAAGQAGGLVYQVSAAGLRPDQVRLALDRAKTAVLGRIAGGGWVVDPPAPPGMAVVGREFDGGAPDGGVDAEGVEPNKRWTAHARFRIHVVTATGAV